MSGDLQATLAFSVELLTFHNVDLFQRGYYQIQCTLKPPVKAAANVTAAVWFESGRTSADYLLSAEISPSGTTGISKTFQILYKNEEVLLEDCFVFNLNMLVDSDKIVEQIDQADIQLVVELFFSDAESGPSSESMTSVVSQTIKLHMSCVKGFHHHVPLLFDYYHFAVMDISIHGTLLGLSLPDPSIVRVEPKKNWLGKSAASGRVSTPSFYVTLFSNKNPKTSVVERQLSFAYDTHRSLCSTLLSAQVNLLAYFQCLSEFLPENQRIDLGILDFGERLEEFSSAVEGMPSCDEAFAKICSNFICISSELELAWSQFLEFYCFNKNILPFLRKEHYQQRIAHMSEAFFVQENPWESLQSSTEQSFQQHQSLSQSIKGSKYYQAIPPIQLECPTLDGDNTSMPIIFEDRFCSTFGQGSEDFPETEIEEVSFVMDCEDGQERARNSNCVDEGYLNVSLVRGGVDDSVEYSTKECTLSDGAAQEHQEKISEQDGASQGCSADPSSCNADGSTEEKTAGLEDVEVTLDGERDLEGEEVPVQQNDATESAGPKLSEDFEENVSKKRDDVTLDGERDLEGEEVTAQQNDAIESADPKGSEDFEENVSKKSDDVTLDGERGSLIGEGEEVTVQSNDPTESTDTKISKDFEENVSKKSDEGASGLESEKDEEHCGTGGTPGVTDREQSPDSVERTEQRGLSDGELQQNDGTTQQSELTSGALQPEEDTAEQSGMTDGTLQQNNDATQESELTDGALQQNEDIAEQSGTTDGKLQQNKDTTQQSELTGGALQQSEDTAEQNALTSEGGADFSDTQRGTDQDTTNTNASNEPPQKEEPEAAKAGHSTESEGVKEGDAESGDGPVPRGELPTPCRDFADGGEERKSALSVDSLYATQVTAEEQRTPSAAISSTTVDSQSHSSEYETATSSETLPNAPETTPKRVAYRDDYPQSTENVNGVTVVDSGPGASKKSKKKSNKVVSASIYACFPMGCAGDMSPSLGLCRMDSVYGGTASSRFEIAKRLVKRSLNYSYRIYSDIPLVAEREPYFTAKPPETLETHLIVCVHGLDGNSGDLRLVRCYLEMALPSTRLDFLMSEINQSDTFVGFEAMTTNLVQEIIHHIEAYTLFPTKLSFIGHSLGNLIIRSALCHPDMEPFLDKLHTFLSLSGPHLGMLFQTSSLVSTGLWLMQKWKKSDSLSQLTLHDSPDLRQTFIYRLSQSKGLCHFKNVLLVSSVQDHYVPYHSARMEMCRAALKETSELAVVYREMVHNLLSPLKDKTDMNFVRYSVFHAIPSSANSLIGRAAHIAMLDSELFIEKLLLVSALEYFR